MKEKENIYTKNTIKSWGMSLQIRQVLKRAILSNECSLATLASEEIIYWNQFLSTLNQMFVWVIKWNILIMKVYHHSFYGEINSISIWLSVFSTILSRWSQHAMQWDHPYVSTGLLLNFWSFVLCFGVACSIILWHHKSFKKNTILQYYFEKSFWVFIDS